MTIGSFLKAQGADVGELSAERATPSIPVAPPCVLTGAREPVAQTVLGGAMKAPAGWPADIEILDGEKFPPT